MHKHKNHAMHKHSHESLQAIIHSGKRQTVLAKIYKLLTDQPPLTDKQIAKALKMKVANVQPRISDGVACGVFFECGESKDPESGLPVRLTRIRVSTDPEPMEQEQNVSQSRQKRMAQAAVRWCKQVGIDHTNPKYIVAALVSLGVIR